MCRWATARRRARWSCSSAPPSSTRSTATARGRRPGPRAARADRRRGRDRQDGARARVLRARAATRRVLWGACDALLHAAPARAARRHRRRGRRRARRGGGRGRRAGRARRRRWRDAARAGRPTIVVLEDLHWADEATLDVLRLLARRIESLPALVLATYRDDELDRAHPLRDRARRAAQRRGGAAGARAALRRRRSPSSPAAAASTPRELHRADRRQPVLRDRGARGGRRRDPRRPSATPCSRAPRGSTTGARALLDAVAIVPPRAELWLLEALADGELDDLDACLASGHAARRARRGRASATRSRASRSRRRWRRTAGWRCTAARSRRSPRTARAPTSPASPTTPRRPTTPRPCCATRRRPASGRRRSGRTARRRRSSPARCATPTACRPSARAELLERRSYECYLTDDIAGRHRRAPARARRSTAPPATALREGDAHRWLSRLALVLRRQRDGRGGGAAGGRAARAAARPGASWRWPTATWRSCGCSPATSRGATHWGERAIALAERARRDRDPRPRAQQRRHGRAASAAMPAGARSSSAASRSRSRPASRSTSPAPTRTSARARCRCARLRARRSPPRRRDRATAREHDLDSWLLYMTGWRARSRARPGALGRRGGHAPRSCSAAPTSPAPSRITPLVGARPPARAPRRPRPVGAARRGARARARHGRAAARWRRSPPPAPRRAGSPARASAIAAETDARSRSRSSSATLGRAASCCLWRRRAGIVDDARARRSSPSRSGSSWRASSSGRPSAGRAIGCPYEAALAPRPRRRRRRTAARRWPSCSASAPTPAAAPRRARACASAACATSAAGPRAATRENPAGLTARELEVARARGRGAAQRRDRRAAVPLREDGRPPRLGDPAQARRRHAQPGRCRGRPPRDRRKIGSPPDVGSGARAYGRRVPRTTTATENLMTPERGTTWTCT